MRCERKILGNNCTVIVTYNEKLKRKQEHTFARGLEKIKNKALEKWNSYKRKPKQAVPKGIESILNNSQYGKYLIPKVSSKGLEFREDEKEVKKHKMRFGKNIIFSNMMNIESGFMISTYREKNKIEIDNKLLKDKDIICFIPIRHWTDSKIRAYAFCCVISMTLLKVMQLKASLQVYHLSTKLLIEELRDITYVYHLHITNRYKY